ncbi:MAG: FmdB family transcriptional regulator [Candidatus Wallbacteria bacterium HGW-Wallbacteria-1]|uniref:FmdB family transcriptional regulator n=1 Tax=Candidatus Wallbacteria bacterium HGW-Wallbacteria-1 TaxID=2013854 RepID=A0A2N1PJJ5_9BACT|nr:MAG: FmdB family transcriptional regulator [Candidatus Wallbacteria bacterium HGW-Wallbacteria-1]
MPTYEYECNGCGLAFEKFQKMSDEPVRVCPDCDGDVRKVPSLGGGIIFKGSGFYVTDAKGRRSSATEPKSTESAPCGDAATSCPAASKCCSGGSCGAVAD